MKTDPYPFRMKWVSETCGLTSDEIVSVFDTMSKMISTEPDGAYPIEDDVTKRFYIYGLDVEVTLPRHEMPKDYRLVLSHIVNHGRNY